MADQSQVRESIKAFLADKAGKELAHSLFRRMPLLQVLLEKSPQTDLRVAMILRMQGVGTEMSLLEIWERIKIKHELIRGLGPPHNGR